MTLIGGVTFKFLFAMPCFNFQPHFKGYTYIRIHDYTTTQSLGRYLRSNSPNCTKQFSFNHWQLLDETRDQAKMAIILSSDACATWPLLTFPLKSHVALGNTWHCPIRWGINGLQNFTLFVQHEAAEEYNPYCTSTSTIAPLHPSHSLVCVVFSSLDLLEL